MPCLAKAASVATNTARSRLSAGTRAAVLIAGCGAAGDGVALQRTLTPRRPATRGALSFQPPRYDCARGLGGRDAGNGADPHWRGHVSAESSAAGVTSLHDVVVTVEFWSSLFGALAGALAAFGFAILQRWWERREEHVTAARQAVFALAQMYTYVALVNRQWLNEGAAEARAKLTTLGISREPLYFEYLPISASANPGTSVRLDRLDFLLRSHAPDLVGRIAAAERSYLGVVETIEQRNGLHLRFQEKMASLVSGPAVLASVDQLEGAVGRDLMGQIRALTEVLQRDIPSAEADLAMVARQASDVLKHVFPMARMITVEPTTPRAFTDTTADGRPAAWRRVVRIVVSKWRNTGHVPIGGRETAIACSAAAVVAGAYGRTVLAAILAALSGFILLVAKAP